MSKFNEAISVLKEDTIEKACPSKKIAKAEKSKQYKKPKIGAKVKLSENGGELTIIKAQRCFGKSMHKVTVEDADGNRSTHTQDKLIFKAEEEDIEKGKKDPVGTVRNGRKKVAEGKWVPVKEGGKGEKKSATKPRTSAAGYAKQVLADKNADGMAIEAAEKKVKARIKAIEKKPGSRKLMDEKYELEDLAKKLEKKGYSRSTRGIKKSDQDSIDILKSEEAHYAFSGSNVTFKKKGKELKDKATKKYDYIDMKKEEVKKDMKKLKNKLQEKGVKFVEGEDGYDRPQYKYDDEGLKQPIEEGGEKTIYNCIHEYNNLMWKCKNLKKECVALEILKDNFEENKSYEVTLRQLQSLEKSEDIDIEKAEE